MNDYPFAPPAPPASAVAEPSSPRFVDRRSFFAGVLTITAAVLLVGCFLSLSRPRTAYAIGMNAAGGDYVVVTQQVSESQEAVLVIDAAAERLAAYGYDFSRRVLLPLDGFDLRNLQRRPGNRGR
jgi:hypothetical protein